MGGFCSMQLTEKQIETLKRNNEESNYVTRESIQDALYLLMEKSNYEDITITQIIKKSGVSRSAFYRNYKSKEDIIKDILTDLFRRIESEIDSIEINWTSGFNYFYENKKSLNLITKAHLEYLFLDKINEQLTYDNSTDNYIQAMNHGIAYNVLLYWIKCGMTESPSIAVEKTIEAYKSLALYVSTQLGLN